MVVNHPTWLLYNIAYIITISISYNADDDVVLPVDPSLHSTFTANLPPLTGNETSNIDFSKEVNKQSASVVLSEGLPPISTKLLEKIQQWEFVDLTSLLSGDPSTSAKNDTVTLSQEGQQIVVVDPQSHPSRRKRQIVDLPTWIQAFSIYAAGLAAASSTTKEQVMGLMAHMFLMVQLSRDLGGNHWLQYDKDFREWAAAKNLKVWGELNLTIYGRCLAMHQRPILAPRSDTFNRSSEKRAKSQLSQRGCCYKWNFDGTCQKSASTCRYRHVCHYCGDDHRAANCPSQMRKVFKSM